MEGLDVTCAPDGVPLSFVLGGSTWQVAADAVRWFERTPWWELVTSIPRGRPFSMDIEVWQLQAHQDQKPEPTLVTFVLVRDQNTGEWTVRSMNDIST